MTFILKKIKNKICILTVNRPEHYNAVNMDVLSELDAKLDWIVEETDCRAVILTGKGDKAFIAGADIQAMQKMNKNQAEQFSKMGQDLTIKIERFKIPIIAAVNGFALGGGCEFAMACHFRYASDNAVFGQPEVSLGLIAGWGGTQRLPRLVGKGRAFEILLSGKNINAEDAQLMGLLNKVVPLEKLMPTVINIATLIVKNAPLAITATIKSINNVDILAFNEGLLQEQAEFFNLFDTEDTCEGLSAFVEKRKPKYSGK